MKCRIKVGSISAGICLVALSGLAYADDKALNFELLTAASFYTRNFPSPELRSLEPRSFNSQSFNSMSYLLAANEGNVVQGQAGTTSTIVAPETPAAAFKPPMISRNKVHQYLGLGTLALFGLTAISAPDREKSATPQTTGTHQSLGRATAAMATATVVSGLVAHWDDIYLEDSFFDPDKLHARLGTLGALAMLYTVSVAPGHGHPATGIAGGVAMIVAVKLTW
jgi:hypothetical protein